MSYDRDAEYVSDEYMGLCGISRISGRNERMFGTDVPHNSWLELTIRKGCVKRKLNQEWYSSEGKHIVIELTHSQFSEMISNMNCNYGVPCTVKEVAGKRMKNPDRIDRTGQFSEEFKKDMENVAQMANRAVEAMEKLLAKNGATKKDKNEILSLLGGLKQSLQSNMPFVEKQFRRCMAAAVDDAKRNIEGHALNIALSAAKRGLVTEQESEEMIEYTDSNNILIGYDQED